MSYQETPLTQGRRAGSTRSKMNLRTLRLALTPAWQRILQLLLRKRTEEADDGEDQNAPTSEPLNEIQDAESYCTMSGALLNDHICKDYPHLEPCLTGSCSTRAQDRSNAIQYNKPLPPRPHMSSGSNAVENRASHLSAMARYSTYIDARFSLDKTERKILHYLQQLSIDELVDPCDLSIVTVQLGEYKFRMSEGHAAILQRIHSLTEPLSADVKADLIRNLDHLVEEPHRYPFEEIVASRFRIIRETPTKMEAGDNESQTDTSTDLSNRASMAMAVDPTEDLRPAPLRIRKRLPVHSRRWSRLSEDTEPRKQVNLSRTQRRVMKAREKPEDITTISTTDLHDSSSLGSSYEEDHVPALPEKSPIRSLRRSSSAPYGSLYQRLTSDFTDLAGHGSVEQTLASPRQPGSVTRARNALHERQRLTRAEGENHMQAQQQLYPLKNYKQPGKVNYPLDGMYMTPRPAPTPPIRLSLISSYSDPYLIPTRTQSSSQTETAVRKQSNLWDQTVARIKDTAVTVMSKQIGGLERARGVPRSRMDMKKEAEGYTSDILSSEESAIVRPHTARGGRAAPEHDNYHGGLRGGGGDFELDQMPMSHRLTRRFSALFDKFSGMYGGGRPVSGAWLANGGKSGKRRAPGIEQLLERSNEEACRRGFVENKEAAPGARKVHFLQQDAIDEEEEPSEEMIADTSSSIYDTDT